MFVRRGARSLSCWLIGGPVVFRRLWPKNVQQPEKNIGDFHVHEPQSDEPQDHRRDFYPFLLLPGLSCCFVGVPLGNAGLEYGIDGRVRF